MIPQNDAGETRNLIIAGVLCVLVLFVYQNFFAPQYDPTTTETSATNADGTPATPGAVPNNLNDSTSAVIDNLNTIPLTPPKSRKELVENAKRIPISTDTVVGSILLKGGLLDDLSLKDYKETLDEGSGIIHLLNPTGIQSEGEQTPYFVAYGWIPSAGVDAPGPNTDWSVESGNALSVGNPVTLVWDNGAGLIFRRTYSIDDKYLFDITA